MPANEYFSRQNYTHFAVYITKLLYGVPYADVLKIVEQVEERHHWDQQLLQGMIYLYIYIYTVNGEASFFSRCRYSEDLFLEFFSKLILLFATFVRYNSRKWLF